MKDNKITILHVFIDGMTFSAVADNYETIADVENLYLFYAPQQDFKLKKIKDDRVNIIHDFEKYVSYFSSPEIDVILFYSLPYQYYYLFDYIDNSKYVIWWAWGYDIYNGQGNYPPLLPIGEMYKPLTKDFMLNKISKYSSPYTRRAYRFLRRCLRIPIRIWKMLSSQQAFDTPLIEPHKTQDEILARIDAIYAPLDVECEMLKKVHPTLTAEMFKRPQMPKVFPKPCKKEVGNVLVNHSLTYTVNHLDVFESLYKVDLEDKRKFVFPVSYGINGYKGDPYILKSLAHFKKGQTLWLDKILPYDQYQSLFSSISHAVFGMIRQQGLGNIFLCLRTGVKVYLYKDSIVYKELKKMGYICYTIENDLTTESLATCLSEEDTLNNYNIFVQRCESNAPEKCRAMLEQGIAKKVN